MASDTQPRESLTPGERQQLEHALVRLNEQAWGITLGMLCGLGLFLATVVLIARGGPVVGPHLELLGMYLPGYHVTWSGAVLGLLYGFVLGYAVGWSIGAIYNRLVTVR